MPSPKTGKIQKARAIIIKEKNMGESNKQLTILAKDLGKLVVFAKGARNHKSKFFSGAQPFCYCDLVLFDGGDFLSVTQIELIKNFSSYYNDVYKMMYGSFFLELADKTVMFSQEANDIMLLLLKGLHKLENADSPKKISATFQIKLFDLLGLCPETDICSLCGKAVTDGELYLPQAGRSDFCGFACAGCGDGKMIKAQEGFIAALEHIKNANAEVFSFNVSASVLEQLNVFAEMLVSWQLEADLKSPGIIKSL